MIKFKKKNFIIKHLLIKINTFDEGLKMSSPKTATKVFDFAMLVKEKKLTLPEYVIFKRAFLEGLMITKEWLINTRDNNPEYSKRIDKVLGHINLETVEYELRILDTLRNEETDKIFKYLDTQIVVRPSVVTKNPLTSTSGSNVKTQQQSGFRKPNIVSKEELKNEIQLLYQQEDNYDICLNKTSELLQHPDLTEKEKQRYTTFYHELLEWVNLKNRKQEQESDEVSVKQPDLGIDTSESRGTSISQLRTSMLKELNKLRNLYIDPKEK